MLKHGLDRSIANSLKTPHLNVVLVDWMGLDYFINPIPIILIMIGWDEFFI